MTEVEYTSCSCNRTPNAVSWGSNKTVIYATSKAIAICRNDTPAQVEHMCTGHTGRVNAVTWIRRHPAGQDERFVSVSTDKTAKVWKHNKLNQIYECSATLQGHTNTVNVVAGLCIASDDGTACRTIIVTASVDSAVKIWQQNSTVGQMANDFVCTQTIQFGTGFCLHTALSVLPGSNVPVVACGADDHKIHVFIERDEQLTRAHTIVGHEDWIRALDFTTDDNGDLLLASGSQDTYIRIYRFSQRDPVQMKETHALISQLHTTEDIKMKENTFFFKDNGVECCFAVSLESVLQGHDNWVYSVQWQPGECVDGVSHQPMCLLSASMDKTMILWAPESTSGIWTDKVRVGEVGGNSLGFYGGVFGPHGNTIMAHGYQGAFQMWTHNQDTNSWDAQVTCGGHFDSVEDIAWQRGSGDFLLSTSVDQTTRCHGYWKSTNHNQSGWYEIARPQIHGYDMQCIAMIDKYSFAAGADEKVMRIFEAPRNFVENFMTISKLDLSEDLKSMSLPEGASVPALGLSNKAVYEGEMSQAQAEQADQPKNQYPEVYFVPQTLRTPPDENNLLQNSLWPETQKLYGHGYELFAVACHPRVTVLATACKASKAEHAYIILWDCVTWRQSCELHSHALTVTQLCFSHTGSYLLSVSRDRTWSVFKERDPDASNTEPLYKRIAFSDKKTSIHTRIIWACAWSHDDAIFVTVSRDKKALLWSAKCDESSSVTSCLGPYECCCAPLELCDSITTVDFAPCLLPCGSYLLAFGLDNGYIVFYKWNRAKGKSKDSWTECTHLQQSDAHHMTVKRIQFRPRVGKVGTNGMDNNLLQLASCGADHTVKIYTIDISQIS